MSNFYTDLEEKGNPSEAIVVKILQEEKDSGIIKAFRRTEHTEYWNKDLDFESDFVYKTLENKLVFLEVKSIAGVDTHGNIRDTFCVESWADDNKTKRPGWYRTAQHCEDNNLEAMIVFHNRLTKTLYFHNSIGLRKYVEFNGSLTYSKSPNEDERGWVVLYGWEYGPTFIKKVILP